MTKANDTLQRVAGINLATAVRNIERYWNRASAADIESGAMWYGDAGMHVDSIARIAGISRESAAVVIAHLSPRTTWARNLAGAYAMAHAHAAGTDVISAARAVGCIRANVERAARAFSDEDPFATFGPSAHKTRSFAANILGDRDAVTVDVWAARIALTPRYRRGWDGPDAETMLGRAGMYAAVAHAYRVAARRAGVDPTTMQATTWVVARNGRAA
jgi:hypothetical protein